MTDQNVHEMWSDADLDLALATLRSDVDTEATRLAHTRDDLFGPASAKPPEPGRAWVRWVAVAAAVAVLVGAVFVLLHRRPEPPRPATPPSPVERIKAVDEPQRLGQFRYIGTHATLLARSDTYAFLAASTTDTWMPAREQRDWMLHRTVDDNWKFLSGNKEDVLHAKPLDMLPPGLWHARCGDYFKEQPDRCTGTGSWGEPDQEFMRSLPRDPQRLYDRLSAESKGGQGHEHNMLTTAADLLRAGTVPADLRLAVYRALAKLPHLEVTENIANLDGRTGLSLAIAGPATRDEIFVDPATGQFIGERVVTARAEDGLPADTAIVDTAVTYAVVDQQGDVPAH
jgi:hypothetical protein